MEPLFAGSSLRVDVASVPLIEGLTFASTGRWVLVLGAPRALFEAAAALRSLARGTLTIAGAAPALALRSGIATAAARDPPLPNGWSAMTYIAWSARLSGRTGTDALRAARDALTDLGAEAAGATRLGRAPVALRRAVVLAAALATPAQVLLVEDLLDGLDAAEARRFARAMTRAAQDRAVVYFAPRLALDSPIALAADEALVFAGSRVAAQGAPAEIAAAETTFGLRIRGNAAEFAGAAAERGALVVGAPLVGATTEMTLSLGPLTTLDLFRIAQATNVLLLELRPIAPSFA